MGRTCSECTWWARESAKYGYCHASTPKWVKQETPYRIAADAAKSCERFTGHMLGLFERFTPEQKLHALQLAYPEVFGMPSGAQKTTNVVSFEEFKQKIAAK